jgi:hypothetical protein
LNGFTQTATIAAKENHIEWSNHVTHDNNPPTDIPIKAEAHRNA